MCVEFMSFLGIYFCLPFLFYLTVSKKMMAWIFRGWLGSIFLLYFLKDRFFFSSEGFHPSAFSGFATPHFATPSLLTEMERIKLFL